VTKVPTNVLELPISERGLVALKQAVKKTIDQHAREGLPIYVWRDGKVTEIPPDQLAVESAHLQAERSHPLLGDAKTLK
jgi:hypothetical protein